VVVICCSKDYTILSSLLGGDQCKDVAPVYGMLNNKPDANRQMSMFSKLLGPDISGHRTVLKLYVLSQAGKDCAKMICNTCTACLTTVSASATCRTSASCLMSVWIRKDEINHYYMLWWNVGLSRRPEAKRRTGGGCVRQETVRVYCVAYRQHMRLI
jgi:hypothetical protein